jgi:hypothetical protein
MGQGRYHYERAFEEYLRSRRIPYISIDEARKALLPSAHGAYEEPSPTLKSFDFVIYGEGTNLLVDIKGRRLADRPARRGARRNGAAADPSADLALLFPRPRRPRLESWVTQDDVDSLARWQQLFGPDFEAGFVFIYWCDAQPADALFEEIFEHRGRWYALRAVSLAAYRSAMKPRSTRWRTVDLPARAFDRMSHPFAPASGFGRRPGPAGAPDEDDPGPSLPALHPLAAPVGSVP